MPRNLAALLPPLTLAFFMSGAIAEENLDEATQAITQVEQPETAAPRPAPDSRSETAAVALQRQVPVHQQLRLDGGNDAFLGLWQPANQAQAKGLVIILPGEGETADWPRAIGPLRRQLPDAGWSTLSLTLPDAPNAGIAPRRVAEAPLPLESTAAEDAAQAPETAEFPVPATNEEMQASLEAESLELGDYAAEPVEEAVIDADQAHSEQMLARIDAALEYAYQQQPRTIVLLGHGTGAYWAAHYLREKQPHGVANLLLVAPRAPEDVVPGLDEVLPDLRLATGDFYYRNIPAQRSAARERLQASKRQKHPSYVQVGLQALPGDAQAEQGQLVRRVRGWLELEPRASR